MIVLDSTFLINIIRNDRKTLKILKELNEIPIYTTIINVYEIWFGFNKNKKLETNTKWRTEIKNRIESLLKRILILDLTSTSVLSCAEIAGTLAKNGSDIGDKDAMIAGIMKSNGLKKILTNNVEHFHRINDVYAINDSAEVKEMRNFLTK